MENLLVPYQAVTHIPCTRALVLAPHPDDEVFGCGGAIMRHVEQGVPVCVMVVSDGTYAASAEHAADYIRTRQRESEAAAKVLGYGTPVFWHYRDREICYGEKLVQEILTAIDETQADLVYAPSVFEIHSDHRALGMATVEAIRRLGKTIQLALYEIGMPLRPNCLLNISDLAARKLTAMQCFVSQNAQQRYDLDIAALNRYRTYTLPTVVTAAEAYILISAEELANDPLKLYQSEHARQKELGLTLDSRDCPLVSVIIRSMDRPTLSDALDSVALQTYPQIEVVVVNAKGTGHREMAGWCGRFPLRMAGEGEIPLHRSRAGNVGLRAASGDYLLFLDDDDWLAADHVAKLADALAAHPACLAAHTGIACVDEEKKITSGVFGQAFDTTLLMAHNFIPIHAVLFSRQLVERGCLMDETLDYYEDWDFWLQASLQSDFVFTPGISGYYRIYDSSGVHRQEAFSGAAYARIYDKWRSCWPAERLAELMGSFWNAHVAQGRLEQELADTRTQLADCHAELNSVYRSRSWRITVPLRQISLMIKNFFSHS